MIMLMTLITEYVLCYYTTTTTTTTNTTVLWPFVYNYPGEPVSEETFTHSHTHTYPDHQSSFICFLHLLLSIASSLFNLCLAVFLHSLSPNPLWSISWSGTLHFILHTFDSSPIYCFIFTTHAHSITSFFAVVPRLCDLIVLSLSTLYLELNTHIRPSDHFHLCLLKCHLIFFSYRPYW